MVNTDYALSNFLSPDTIPWPALLFAVAIPAGHALLNATLFQVGVMYLRDLAFLHPLPRNGLQHMQNIMSRMMAADRWSTVGAAQLQENRRSSQGG